MVYEAVIVNRLSDPIDFTVADGVTISGGSLLKLTDPRTAIINSGKNDRLAGILARDKVANDGHTQVPVFRYGIFDMTASGAVTVGDIVCAEVQANTVAKATSATSGASVLGYALETASAGEVINILVNVGAGASGYGI